MPSLLAIKQVKHELRSKLAVEVYDDYLEKFEIQEALIKPTETFSGVAILSPLCNQSRVRE